MARLLDFRLRGRSSPQMLVVVAVAPKMRLAVGGGEQQRGRLMCLGVTFILFSSVDVPND